MFVRELQDGQEVDQVLLVREAELRSTRGGSDYLRLALLAVPAADVERERGAAHEHDEEQNGEEHGLTALIASV